MKMKTATGKAPGFCLPPMNLREKPKMAYTDQWKELIVGKMAATILNFKSPTHISVRLGVLQEGFAILKNKLNCLYSARMRSRLSNALPVSLAPSSRGPESNLSNVRLAREVPSSTCSTTGS